MVPDPDPIPAWLGLDVGTSAVKAMLADAAGRTLARCNEALVLATPSALAAEQEADDWWAAAVRAIAGCLGARPEARVEAVGLTGQKHGLLALGPGGEPLASARLWADGRAVAEAADMARRVPRLARRTGAPPLPGYLVPKWMYWSGRHPRLAGEARHLCFVKDYLRLRLTGAYATDPTEASASQLWDASRRSWSPSLCAAFGVPLAALPARGRLRRCHGDGDRRGRGGHGSAGGRAGRRGRGRQRGGGPGLRRAGGGHGRRRARHVRHRRRAGGAPGRRTRPRLGPRRAPPRNGGDRRGAVGGARARVDPGGRVPGGIRCRRRARGGARRRARGGPAGLPAFAGRGAEPRARRGGVRCVRGPEAPSHACAPGGRGAATAWPRRSAR